MLTITSQHRIAIVGHTAMLPLVWVLHRLGLVRRYVLVLHGVEAWRKLGYYSRAAARQAHAIVATTHYTVREFCYHNAVHPEQCVVIPLACSAPEAKASVPRAFAPLRLVTVSRLSAADAYKGIDTVLHALRFTQNKGLPIHLDVIGEGDDRQRLQRLADELGITPSVHFWGAVEDSAVQSVLSTAHVFVMPSKKEGFGIVFLEAMAAGLPCIGANHGGTPEVIEHGKSGFLIEYDDRQALAFYLSALSESPDLYRRLSNEARDRATYTLSFASMSAEWTSLLQRLQQGIAPAARDGSLATSD